jgi:transposase
VTPRERGKGEAVRLRAAAMLAAGMQPKDIAAGLRVSPRSVRRWRAAWVAGGEQALASQGPGGSACRLDEAQLRALTEALDQGPAAYGWVEDQRWTLARVAQLVFELFRVRYTPRGVSSLLHRIGDTPQVPRHVAAEQDGGKVTTWVRETWPRIKASRPGSGRGSFSPTRPGSLGVRPKPVPGPGAG